jgi:hypothetical protein
MSRRVLSAAFFLWAVSAAHGQDPPVVGRPANFSGAIGSYRVTTKAEPTDVQAEDPVTFTVRIAGTGPLRGVVRPDLRKLPRFARQFHIKDAGERDLPTKQAREYDYLLRPRTADVTEVPSLPFVYFKPGVIPEHKGYQTTTAAAIPLTVRPRAAVPLAPKPGPTELPSPPETAWQYVPAERLADRQEPPSLPGLVTLLVLFGAAPAVCVATYWFWTFPLKKQVKLGPEARQTLAALAALHARPLPERARGAAEAVTEYFRNRLSIDLGEPTPHELSGHLLRRVANRRLADRAERFVARCDVYRFAPEPPRDNPPLLAEAEGLIADAEDLSWLNS